MYLPGKSHARWVWLNNIWFTVMESMILCNEGKPLSPKRPSVLFFDCVHYNNINYNVYKCRNGAIWTGGTQTRQSQVLIWHGHEIRAYVSLQTRSEARRQVISNTNNGNIIGGACAWQHNSDSLLTTWRHMTENQGSGCVWSIKYEHTVSSQSDCIH